MTTVQLLSGVLFDPFRPDPALIDLESVATALSHIARFNGQTKWLYSVAQHAVLVSEHCHPGWADCGLHHDDSEGLGLGDLCAPIKHHADMAQFCMLEDAVMTAVCERFELPWPFDASVKVTDRRMCMTEKRDLQHAQLDMYDYQPFNFAIEPWSSDYARDRYLQRHEETWWLTLLTVAERNNTR